MGVEFCIWIWRMYRSRRKQERLEHMKRGLPANELRNIPQKSNVSKGPQPVR
jgi:hypothetical protein